AGGLPDLPMVGGRDLGERVTEHRSSWVRRLQSPSGTFYVKTYDFPTWTSRIRAILRRPTAAWRARAEREFEALLWLRGHGFVAPLPIAALVWRTAGLLRRAVLITAAHPGEPVSELLPTLPAPARHALAAASAAVRKLVHQGAPV